jgi:8-amino-7-oxononanoate synthase
MDLSALLNQLKAASLYRSRRVLDSAQGAEVVVDGTTLLSFCSNDYLGLAAHPRVREALERGARQYGFGSGSAHLLVGHARPHHALEEELAEFVQRPRALLFSTGYMANLGAVTALVGAGDAVFEDRFNHASLLDAGLLSRARFSRYAHADALALKQRLSATTASRRLVVTDGVFSMDGDVAPLPQLARVAARHDAWLMVDDAHGLGVIGQGGRGSLAWHDLGQDEVPVLVGTLGKAFGTFGAFVAGSEELIETLIQKARTYIYTTALPPAVAEATRASLALVREEAWRRDHLARLVARFRRGVADLTLPASQSTTPIQPLVVGSPDRALALSGALEQRGILVRAIRPPAVPEGASRLRVTLSAAHTEAHVDRLLESLSSALEEVES